MRLHIKNARLLDPATGMDQQSDLWVAGGRIAAIGQAPSGFEVQQTLDYGGLCLMPGLIDLAVRLREPGHEYRATLESELKAAMAGGITSLVLPPDTDPPLDEPGLIEMLKHRARQLDQVNLYPLGAMTVGLKGQVITEMAELSEAGCIGFAQADEPIVDTAVMLRAMQYARSFGFTLWLRPIDPWLSKGVVASGAYAARLGLSGVPVQSETIALHTLFELQRSVGVKLHICRISSAAGVELIRQAKAQGLPVTCDTTVNHAHLTDVDIGYYDTHYRLDPPLRTQRDREALRQALADGTVDALCSDHTPVDDDGKQMPFAEAESGATGLELLLSLAIKWAREDNIPLTQALARVTSGPAAVLRTCSQAMPPVGSLVVGAPADFCVVNLDDHWIVARQSLVSQSRHTPFLGMELPGRVQATIMRGRVVWERAG
ncbi:dihydroorotase [Orrella daihaiensis]|uniref:Dihydroorotase n=1 Tax=Orrella daihaiensis TaxID=2782176 RepID=A0ABY4AIR8_9BURK|nr:dihydroorotase [Orrella daihaiensis]UOD50191.1 dihydroorotase [Orrella daihaiensis]